MTKKKETSLKNQVREYVQTKVKPVIQMDGGDVDFVDLDEQEGILKLQLSGACVGCPMADVTLKMGIERDITAKFPDIVEVIALD